MFLVETSRGSGSGWLIESGLILTNEHVVADTHAITVRQPNDPPFTVRVVAVDSKRDIALLEFDTTRAQLPAEAIPLPLGEVSNDNIAQTLLALGYSSRGFYGDGTVGFASANVGVLSQIADFGSDALGRNLVMDTPVDPGDSGGPVLNAKGQVVGMVRAVAVETGVGERVVGTFFAVHVDEIRSSLPALKQRRSR